MKTTLTSSDPAGCYECKFLKHWEVLYWTGTHLCRTTATDDPEDNEPLGAYTDFRGPLVVPAPLDPLVRAAAERLNACQQNHPAIIQSDAVLVAQALLRGVGAVEEDDREPLTDEWVQATFPVRPGRGAILSHVLSLFRSRHGWIVKAGKHGANDSNDSFCVFIAETRGDIRRLCSVIANPIPLTKAQ